MELWAPGTGSGRGAVVVFQEPAEPHAVADLAGGEGQDPRLGLVGLGKWHVALGLVWALLVTGPGSSVPLIPCLLLGFGPGLVAEAVLVG